MCSSDLSDDSGSRTARQGASMARTRGGMAQATSSRDEARRRGLPMMGAGGGGRRCGAGAYGAKASRRTLSKMQGWLRSGPQRTGTFSDEPICAGLAAKANLAVAEPREDAQIGRIKRRGPLPRTKPSPYTQAAWQLWNCGNTHRGNEELLA